jgi:DNA-binding NarL/FixJ family response regulator
MSPTGALQVAAHGADAMAHDGDGRAVPVFLVARTRIHREGLVATLAGDSRLVVAGAAADAAQALPEIRRVAPDVVLLEADGAGAVEAVRALVAAVDGAKVLVMSVPEDEAELLAFAEAGIAGYVTADASVEELVDAVQSASRGEMRCSPRVAAALCRHVSELAAEHPSPRSRLTGRQLEIVALVEQGCTNKEIARRLCIEVPTVKNHLANIYERLDVHRRAEAAYRARDLGGRGQDGRGPS